MVRRRKNGSGLTLLEVLIALLVSTIGLLGALAMLGTILGGGQFSRNATEASILAQDRLEELVLLPTTSLPPDGATQTETQLTAFGRVNTTDGSGIYTRNTTLSTDSDPNTSPAGVRRIITVTVSWLDALGRPHAIVQRRERAQ